MNLSSESKYLVLWVHSRLCGIMESLQNMSKYALKSNHGLVTTISSQGLYLKSSNFQMSPLCLMTEKS